jgi:hypothetical protein
VCIHPPTEQRTRAESLDKLVSRPRSSDFAQKELKCRPKEALWHCMYIQDAASPNGEPTAPIVRVVIDPI